VEAAIKQYASSRGAKVNAVERYSAATGGALSAVRRAQPVFRITDLIILADGAQATQQMLQALGSAGVSPRRVQFAGTGLWDDQNVFAIKELEGAWFAAPDEAGFRGFAQRYRARYGSDPARTASLALRALQALLMMRCRSSRSL